MFRRKFLNSLSLPTFEDELGLKLRNEILRSTFSFRFFLQVSENSVSNAQNENYVLNARNNYRREINEGKFKHFFI